MNINELCVPKSFNNLLQRLVSCAARDAEIAMTVEQSAVEMVRAAVQTLPHSQGERFGGVHKDMPWGDFLEKDALYTFIDPLIKGPLQVDQDNAGGGAGNDHRLGDQRGCLQREDVVDRIAAGQEHSRTWTCRDIACKSQTFWEFHQHSFQKVSVDCEGITMSNENSYHEPN